MAKRSFFYDLPDDLRAELHERFVKTGWGSYEEHAEWLTEQIETRGIEISVKTPIAASTMKYAGRTFQEKLDGIEFSGAQAAAIVDRYGDDKGAMADALTMLLQEKMFAITMNLPDPTDDPEAYAGLSVFELVRTASNLNRSSTQVKKFRVEAAQRLAEEAANAAKEAATAAGLTPEQAAQIGEAVSSRVKVYMPDNGR